MIYLFHAWWLWLLIPQEDFFFEDGNQIVTKTILLRFNFIFLPNKLTIKNQHKINKIK